MSSDRKYTSAIGVKPNWAEDVNREIENLDKAAQEQEASFLLEHTPTGEHKETLTASSGLYTLPGVAYLSTRSFTAEGNVVSVCVLGRRVLLTQTANTSGTLIEASYDEAANKTTVTVDCNVDEGLSVAELGVDPRAVQPSVGENLLINGCFRVWQRGMSFDVTAAARYIADHWRLVVNSVGGAAVTVNRVPLMGALSSVGAGDAVNSLLVNIGNGGNENSIIILRQYIEDVRTLANCFAMLSGYLKCDAARSIYVELVQNTGTGGTPDEDRILAGVKIAAGTAWQKFQHLFDIPSVEGLLTGANDDHALSLNVWMSAGSAYASRTDNLGIQTGLFQFANLKLEEGMVATPFAHRPIQQEIELCQRYYCTGFFYVSSYNWSTTGSGYLSELINFPSTMRVIPSVSLSNLVTNKVEHPEVCYLRDGSFVARADHDGTGGTTTLSASWAADAEF